jgi:hypothetical protein
MEGRLKRVPKYRNEPEQAEEDALACVPRYDGEYSRRTNHYLGSLDCHPYEATHLWYARCARERRAEVARRWPHFSLTSDMVGTVFFDWLTALRDRHSDGAWRHYFAKDVEVYLLCSLRYDSEFQEILLRVANEKTSGWLPTYPGSPNGMPLFDNYIVANIGPRLSDQGVARRLFAQYARYESQPAPHTEKTTRALINVGSEGEFQKAYNCGAIDPDHVRSALADHTHVLSSAMRWVLFNYGFDVECPGSEFWKQSYGWSRRAHNVLRSQTLMLCVFHLYDKVRIGDLVFTILLCFRRLCPRMPPDIREMLLVRVMN